MKSIRQKTLVFLAFLAVCSAAALSQTPEATKVFDQSVNGVVGIITYGADKAETGTGSAFAVAEDVVATAYHNISQAYDAEAITAKGKKIKVEGVIGVDKAHDIALLKLKGKLTPLALTTAGPETLTAGSRLFAIGNNESRQINVSEGTFRRLFDAGGKFKAMEMSIAISERDKYSGGPILDLGGQILGMVLVFDRGFRLGVPAAVVQAVSRSAKATDFKSWTREDYFETPEGAAFAGLAAAGLDELALARRHLERAVKLNPSSTEAVWALAVVYDKQRDLTSAVDTYKKVTELDPSRAEAFYRLGGVLYKMQKYSEAVAAYQKASSLNFEAKELYFDLAAAYEASQGWTDAAQAYEKYISLKPEKTANAYFRLAFCRTQLNQLDAAIAAYLEALKEDPKDLNTNNKLADVYAQAGQFDKAEETYYRLAEINPKDAKVYYGQVMRIYSNAKQYDKAVAPAKKILDLDPKNSDNVFNMALMYFQAQKYDDAVSWFKQALALKPDMANAWFQIGSSYFQQKKYREAIEPYKKFTEMSPNEPAGWASLGFCYMYIGAATKAPKDFEGALEPMKKAVDLKPDNPNYLFNLAVIYINLKDQLSARDILGKLQTLDPSLAEKLKKYLR